MQVPARRRHLVRPHPLIGASGLAWLAASLGLACAAHAAEPPAGLLRSAFDPHTVRTLHVVDPSRGPWEFAIQPLSEAELMRFTTRDGLPIDVNAFLPITTDFQYGFSFLDGADFDIAYAITAISRDQEPWAVGNPKCVFVLTAFKPAVPQTQVVNFAGAACKVEHGAAGNLVLSLDKL